MSKSLIYAGIGSRETPQDILEVMYTIAQQLAEKWILRSGHAPGADTAFEMGCDSEGGTKEIYIPWFGFNGADRNNREQYIRPKATQELADFTAQFHPAWNKCSDAAKLLHMRNVYQVLGEEQNSTMVICWTPFGKGGGGTGTAIRIAQDHGIPVFDLAIKGVAERLCEFVHLAENPR